MVSRIVGVWSANRKLSRNGLGEIKGDLHEEDFWSGVAPIH